jgi:hypothetical protein
MFNSSYHSEMHCNAYSRWYPLHVFTMQATETLPPRFLKCNLNPLEMKTNKKDTYCTAKTLVLLSFCLTIASTQAPTSSSARRGFFFRLSKNP